MHAALTLAAFAAGALAVPYKRDVVYDYDVVYVTDVVTVTAGQPAPSATPSATKKHKHYGHNAYGGNHWWTFSSSVEAPTSTWTPEPETSTSSSTPAYTPPTTSSSVPAYTPPAYTPTSTSTSTSSESAYTPPPSTSTSAPAYTPPAPSSSSTSEAPTSSAPAPAPTGYNDIVIWHHNAHRANHSASDVVWSDELAGYAKTAASTCIFQHDVSIGSADYGQNLAAGISPDNVGSVVSDVWYNGEMTWYAGLYGQADPSMDEFEKWGHFSQVVWKATTEVGCATVTCPGGVLDASTMVAMADVAGYVTMCNYRSPGNYAGEYGTNVGEPLGDATVTGDTTPSY